MLIEETGNFIFGINENGNKFRPSDWIERIASTFGIFDANRRLSYNPSVKPVKHDGQSCLFVADNLAVINPSAYSYIMGFVTSNSLVVKNTVQPDTKILQAAA